MKTNLLSLILLLLFTNTAFAQPCTPLGDQTTYGSGHVWIGYIYDNADFSNYAGYVNEGNATSPNFDENFGGDNVNYNVNTCAVYTETFSARYRLQETFADGDYEFLAGGDDGFRFSLDGGVTWLINQWGDHGYITSSYTIHLNGSYSLVLEYYENGGGNRVTFSFTPTCAATGSQTIYGTGNIWQGYIYDGTAFNVYKGSVTEGTAGDPGFDESFGGANTLYPTSSCSVTTETFSARYRLRKNFVNGNYIFIVGGDDGYRLSLDGGATWVIDKWADQGYNTSGYFTPLSGMHDLVIEYYESGGDNRISFNISSAVLPITLTGFSGERNGDGIALKWSVATPSTADHFDVEKSGDGNLFSLVGQSSAEAGIVVNNELTYTLLDPRAPVESCFYRLKMTDRSGAVSYSKNIRFQAENFYHGIQVYPTISNGAFTIRSADRITRPSVALYDISGKECLKVELPAIAPDVPVQLRLPVTNILKGIYLLQVTDQGSILDTKKVILN